MKVVIASDNSDKIRELTPLLKECNVNAIPQAEFGFKNPDETGLSFIENAILKARHCSKQTQLPSIADDSGLCVDVLGGAPGVYSARFAGVGASYQDNIEKLLAAIPTVQDEDRTAFFYCAIAYIRHANDPTPLIAQGFWYGKILFVQQGSEGFGYDPIFYIPELKCTAAQLSREEKNRISHRAQAIEKLSKKLKEVYATDG